MPELKNRQHSESLIESAVMSIFRRWEREIRNSTATIDPVAVSESERETLQLALADPFGRASANLAAEISLPLDESIATLSSMFLASFASNVADGLAMVTNRKIAAAVAEIGEEDSKAATDAILPEKSVGGIETKGLLAAAKKLGRRVLDKIKDAWLSVKRAVTVAVTETTRMVTAGERIVAKAWNRTVGSRTNAEIQISDAIGGTATSKPQFAEPMRLVARLFTQGDKKVCPICGPFDGLFEWQWPPAAKGGTPIHVKCRCWLEWDMMPISKIPAG
jgi:hypothetical protein